MKYSVAILAVTVPALLVVESSAQTGGYGDSRISQLQTATSAANFTTDRIRGSVINNSLPRSPVGQFSTGVVSNALGRASKPFSSISRGPSVTPYLALDNPFTSPATSYYTQIRPQLEQQRINQQQQRQNQLLQRQISQFTSQAPYNPAGSENMAPTGHASVFMNHAGYYTMPQPPRKPAGP